MGTSPLCLYVAPDLPQRRGGGEQCGGGGRKDEAATAGTPARHRSFPLLRHPRVRPSQQRRSCGSLPAEGRGERGRPRSGEGSGERGGRGTAAPRRGPGTEGEAGKRGGSEQKILPLGKGETGAAGCSGGKFEGSGAPADGESLGKRPEQGGADAPRRDPRVPTPRPQPLSGRAHDHSLRGASSDGGEARSRAAASFPPPPPLPPPLPPPARGLRERAPGASSLPQGGGEVEGKGKSQPPSRPTDLCPSASFCPRSRAEQRR